MGKKVPTRCSIGPTRDGLMGHLPPNMKQRAVSVKMKKLQSLQCFGCSIANRSGQKEYNNKKLNSKSKSESVFPSLSVRLLRSDYIIVTLLNQWMYCSKLQRAPPRLGPRN